MKIARPNTKRWRNNIIYRSGQEIIGTESSMLDNDKGKAIAMIKKMTFYRSAEK